MNVYDFDRTIYPGDSSIHFWRYCMKHYPSTMKVIPKATAAIFRYKRDKCTWTDVMERDTGVPGSSAFAGQTGATDAVSDISCPDEANTAISVYFR